MARSNDTAGKINLLGYESWTERLRSLSGRYVPHGVDPKAFTGWIIEQKICGFDAAEIGWNAERVERTQEDARRDGADHYYAVFQLDGQSVICRDDRVDKLAAGDIALVDSSRAVRHIHMGGGWTDNTPGSRVAIKFPRQALVTHLGAEPSATVRKHSETVAARLFSQLVLDAATHDDADPSQTEPYLQMAVYDLIGALFGRSNPFQASPHAEKLFQRVCAIIKNSFADPDTGPFEIAAEAGISLRYLQKMFAAQGMTCSQYIQSLRLEYAMRLLRRRAFLKTGQPVSEIAYASGFRDYRYFARAFRSRFGYPPIGIGGEDKVGLSECA
jgi:AraC family transcriptional regulator, positive regulator of tynA and feaB